MMSFLIYIYICSMFCEKNIERINAIEKRLFVLLSNKTKTSREQKKYMSNYVTYQNKLLLDSYVKELTTSLIEVSIVNYTKMLELIKINEKKTPEIPKKRGRPFKNISKKEQEEEKEERKMELPKRRGRPPKNHDKVVKEDRISIIKRYQNYFKDHERPLIETLYETGEYDIETNPVTKSVLHKIIKSQWNSMSIEEKLLW